MTYQKYGNSRVQYKDMVFDSKRECRRFIELEMLEKAGKIHNLRRQVKYTLIPALREPDTIGARGGVIKGKVIERECSYFADFVYEDENGKTVVEDVKGMRTEVYRIKRKLVYAIYGLRIQEI